MSKKVNIIAPGIARNSLLSLFKDYISRKVKEEKTYWSSVGRCLGGRHSVAYLMDLDEDDDDYEAEMEALRRYYASMCDGDDFYVDDDGSIVFPPPKSHSVGFDEDDYFKNLNKLNNKGKYKHRKNRGCRGGKKAKVIDITQPYSGDEENPFDEDMIGTGKIYFYPDYEDKYEKIEFKSLMDFDKYCQEEGYIVPPYVGEVIAYKPVSHCCLNPSAKERGILEIMAEESYADMLFEAADVDSIVTG